jgi:hypothetical protein
MVSRTSLVPTAPNARPPVAEADAGAGGSRDQPPLVVGAGQVALYQKLRRAPTCNWRAVEAVLVITLKFP